MKMKTKISKFSKKKTNKLVLNNVTDITVACSVVHTGKVLTLQDINNNRSSKYTFLSFSI
jgi:hypothetical protein